MKNRIRVERAELRITQQHLADLALKIAQVFNKSVEQVFQLEPSD